MWDKVGEWRNKFGGVGLVVRLKKDLGIDEIRKALKSWNIQDGQIKRMMDRMTEEESLEEESNEMKSDAHDESQKKGHRDKEVEGTQQKMSWKYTMKATVTFARTKVNKATIVNFVESCFVLQEV